MVNILIYGTGKVGQRIAQEIAKESLIGGLFLYNRTRPKSEGLAYDLKDAHPEADIKAIEDLGKISSDLDIIVYSASNYPVEERKRHPMNRSRELSFNKKLIEKSRKELESLVARTNATTFILSNPVDFLTEYFGTKLPKVYGIAGSLDASRYLTELQNLGAKPSFIFLTGRDRSYTIFTDVDCELVEEAEKNIRIRLTNLIEKQGYASEGITQAFVEFLDNYLSKSTTRTHCSLNVDGKVLCHPAYVGNGMVKIAEIGAE